MSSLYRNLIYFLRYQNELLSTHRRFYSNITTQKFRRVLAKPDIFGGSSNVHTSTSLKLFWEPDKKGGYISPAKRVSRKEMVLEGLKELKKEIVLWKDEVKEKLESDPVLVFRPGETDVLWDFTKAENLDNWIISSDSDHNEGYSKSTLEISPSGYGLFSGEVHTVVPKDGKIKRSGYCNIRTKRFRKSFKRELILDWSQYNTLVMKVRGDGRSYLLNLSAEGYFDIWWFDIYHYALYTRGGPHWQIVRIPFSKFFLAAKGRVQDRQGRVPLNNITGFGISVAGRRGHEGAFSLEIDYIGLEFDPLNSEHFAYEMYKMPKFVVAS